MELKKPEKIIPEKVIGYKFGPMRSKLDLASCMSYSLGKSIPFASSKSLGIGLSNDPLRAADLEYTFENSDNFQVFPLNATVVREFNPFKEINNCPGLPRINPNMLLHGEHQTHVRS